MSADPAGHIHHARSSHVESPIATHSDSRNIRDLRNPPVAASLDRSYFRHEAPPPARTTPETNDGAFEQSSSQQNDLGTDSYIMDDEDDDGDEYDPDAGEVSSEDEVHRFSASNKLLVPTNHKRVDFVAHHSYLEVDEPMEAPVTEVDVHERPAQVPVLSEIDRRWKEFCSEDLLLKLLRHST